MFAICLLCLLCLDGHAQDKKTAESPATTAPQQVSPEDRLRELTKACTAAAIELEKTKELVAALQKQVALAEERFGSAQSANDAEKKASQAEIARLRDQVQSAQQAVIARDIQLALLQSEKEQAQKSAAAAIAASEKRAAKYRRIARWGILIGGIAGAILAR